MDQAVTPNMFMLWVASLIRDHGAFGAQIQVPVRLSFNVQVQ